jgi:hypothetical protein
MVQGADDNLAGEEIRRTEGSFRASPVFVLVSEVISSLRVF